jgi:ABC-type Zn uptake system ZnuABC Zn-binding protein ZnuA/ABC-type Mn2+/Zn2+ transport system permease subunit
MVESFSLPLMQPGLVEVLLLAMAGGLLGTWIVLRGLAFHAHAVGTATFPGLVLADGLGFAASLGALGAALVFTGGVAVAARRGADEHGPATALVLVACLAGGVILASDVFHSAANVDSLLFGSLLLIDTGDLVLAGLAAALALGATLTLGPRWLAEGFDPQTAPGLGLRSRVPSAVLLILVAFTAVAALAAVGALLATALLVVPAVTTRLVVDRLVPWQIATVVLAALEGVAGLLLSYWTDAPPGATIAVVAGVVFAAVALLRILRGRRAALAAAAAVGVAGIAGCGSSAVDSAKLQVVATTPVVADFARQVGGDAVQVVQILQPNSDPHAYEPRPSDVRHTADAQVVLESGFELDHWMDDVVDQSGADPEVVDLARRLPVRLAGEEDDGANDPHWWHDPSNATAAVTEIAAAFARADPDQTAAFDANATAYRDQLRALEDQVRACVDAVPADQRKLVTDHDALNYFAHRYGVDVVGAVIPSQSTQAQASAGEVADLVDTIRAQDVKAIFPESSVNAKLARTIARQTGARVGDELYADTLGPAGSAGATYLQAERHNADAIVRGFTGGARGCGDA